MKNAMQKDFWREIGHTRSRFFSIMILVALSVAFLSGLKATAPDMKHTGDDYLDSLHLADIQVLSTLGLTDEDIAALRAQDKIEDAEGEYVIDAFASSDSLDAVVKVLSLTDRGISDVLLREGRMPERADECVVEENMLSLMSISIGDTITLTPGDDLSDALAQDTYTVVGTVRSPVYLAVERGTSTLGSGTVKAYLYLPREAFTLDYYTAAYVRVSGAEEMTAFYDDYDDYIDDVIDSLEDFGDARASLRHDELVDEATEKLDDAQKELDDAKAEADKELGDARKELDDARKELDDGWKEYDDGKQELADSRVKLDDAKAELEDGEQEYADGVKKYDQAVRDYEKGQKDYADGVKDYEKGAQQLADGESELEAGKENGLIPCGLGARDTLRLEAGMPLYGHEMTDDITPKQTGLGIFVKMDKADFIGKKAMEEIGTPSVKRCGLKMIGRGIARENCPVYAGDKLIGHTTSGTHCPYLGGAYAMAIVEKEPAPLGAQVEVEIRGKRVAAEVVKSQFYKRS